MFISCACQYNSSMRNSNGVNEDGNGPKTCQTDKIDSN